jgi:hypothetical protein
MVARTADSANPRKVVLPLRITNSYLSRSTYKAAAPTIDAKTITSIAFVLPKNRRKYTPDEGSRMTPKINATRESAK